MSYYKRSDGKRISRSPSPHRSSQNPPKKQVTLANDSYKHPWGTSREELQRSSFEAFPGSKPDDSQNPAEPPTNTSPIKSRTKNHSPLPYAPNNITLEEALVLKPGELDNWRGVLSLRGNLHLFCTIIVSISHLTRLSWCVLYSKLFNSSRRC